MLNYWRLRNFGKVFKEDVAKFQKLERLLFRGGGCRTIVVKNASVYDSIQDTTVIYVSQNTF